MAGVASAYGLGEPGTETEPRGSARHRAIEVLAVAVGAFAVLSLLRAMEGPAPPLRSDQVAINLMVVKTLHPDWFQGDPLYGTDYHRYHIPAFVGLQAVLARWLGDDPVAALRVLYWPTGFLFVAGHYALFRWATGSPLAAGMGVLSAMTVRNALGGEYWGFGGLDSVQPRVIVEGLIAVLVLAFVRWRTRRRVLAFFLLVGGLTNLHPVSGLHLAQLAAVAHLWLARFRLKAWGEVVTGAGLFVLGASPFLVSFLSGREPLEDPALFPVVRAALDYRFDYLLLPPRLDALLSVAFHASLPAALILWLRRRRGWPEPVRSVTLLGALALLVGFAGTAASQGIGVLADRPYPDIMQLRATRFMYVPLLLAFPLAFRELWTRRNASARLGLIVVFAASLVPPGAVIHSVSEEHRGRVKQLLGMAVTPRPGHTVDRAESTKAEAALWLWVIAHTDRNDRFFTDSLGFRARTLRPITGSFKDGAYVVLAGMAPLYRWYVYSRDVGGCRARRGAGCWFELARTYGATYVVVDPRVSQAIPGDGFVKVWSQSGWSLWRRQEA